MADTAAVDTVAATKIAAPVTNTIKMRQVKDMVAAKTEVDSKAVKAIKQGQQVDTRVANNKAAMVAVHHREELWVADSAKQETNHAPCSWETLEIWISVPLPIC